jgi:hypothetical protein
VLLNSITDVATRPDLLERALLIRHPSIPPARRRTEAELSREFERARPRILGALLDAASGAQRELPNTRLAEHPRMADFAVWVTAAETALGWPRPRTPPGGRPGSPSESGRPPTGRSWPTSIGS